VRSEPTPLDFRSSAEWRRWLERNHAKSEGVWVYMSKKGATRPGLRYPEALDEALCFGWIDGQIKAVDKDRFKQRWTPRRKGSIWSQANRTRVERLIAGKRMAAAGLAAVRAAKRSGKWQAAYSSRVVPRMPHDLSRALRAAAGAQENFRRFPPGHRSRYIGWVVEAKKAETRKRRIAAVVRRAAANRRLGMESPYS